jgi:hypothetical protein
MPLTRRYLLQLGTTAVAHHSLGASWPALLTAGSALQAVSTGAPNRFQQPPDPGIAAANARAAALLAQLNSGLDYFGYHTNYLPILRVSQYEADNAAIAAGGVALQNGLAIYQQQQQNLAQQNAVLKQSRDQAQVELDKVTDERQQIPSQQDQLSTIIDQLQVERDRSKADVLAKVGALNATLHSSGCTIVQVVEIAGAVISVVGTMGSSLPVIAAAAASALGGVVYQGPSNPGTRVQGLIPNVKVQIKDFEIIKGQYDAMVDGYQKAKSAIDAAKADNDVDAVKFLVEDGDFDKIRAEVEKDVHSLPESSEKQAYLLAMDHYLAVTQMRNQQLLAFDGLSFRLQQTGSDIVRWNVAKSAATEQLQRNALADPATIVAQVQGTLNLLRKQLQFQVYQEARALDFWSLQHAEAPRLEQDFNLLTGSLAQLTARKDRLLNNTSNPPGSLTFDITEEPGAADLAALRNTGKYVFQILTDDSRFPDVSQILIDKIEVTFVDADDMPIRPSHYTLSHSGYHAFVSTDGTRLDFMSRTRSITNIVAANGTAVLSSTFATAGDARFTDALGSYVGVSPFTRWELKVNIGLLPSLDTLKKLRLSFTGSAQGA